MISGTYKPTVPEVLPYIREIYSSPDGGSGCCLHIVLDDGNVHDDSVRFCIDWAHRREHHKCQKLATLLLCMSKTQRSKLSKLAH